MKYVFKDNIDVKEYDDFVKNFPSTMFMQLSSWSLVKTSWESSFVGMYNDDKLVCVAMILKRKLFLNKKLFYMLLIEYGIMIIFLYLNGLIEIMNYIINLQNMIMNS